MVRSSAATFDLEEQTFEQRRLWFKERGERYPLIVAELEGTVIGYCSLSRFRDKPAYWITAESSVYVDGPQQGRGIGRVFMEEILRQASKISYHAVIAGIAGDNERARNSICHWVSNILVVSAKSGTNSTGGKTSTLNCFCPRKLGSPLDPRQHSDCSSV